MGNLQVIWSFLTGQPLGYLVFGMLIIVCMVLATFVYQAACSLAEIENQRFFPSLLMVALTIACCAPLIWGIVYLYKLASLQLVLGDWLSALLLGCVSFMLCVVVSTALYVPILRTTLKKGLLTGLFEQLLGLLLFSLLYGALLVVLAVIQLVNKPVEPPAKTTLLAPPALVSVDAVPS